jgi:hypothetical protein
MEGAGIVRLRMALCALAVAGGASVVAAAEASAEAPEFGRCVKVTLGTGAFATSNCTSEGGEKKFDWIAGPPPDPRFTLSVRTETKRRFYFEGVQSKAIIGCEEATATGEITGPKTIGSLSPFEWKGCEAAGIGPENGLISAEVGSGFLGVWKTGESAIKDKLGLELAPLSYAFQFTGGAIQAHAEGDVIGQLANANSMNTSKTLSLVVTRKLTQVPEKFVGEPATSMVMTVNGAPEPVVISWRSKLTTSEKVEVNSVF